MSDRDGDGLVEDLETYWLTDPLNPDTDGDGLRDGEEVMEYQTHPKKADTDGDGYDDGTEISAGSDPLDANSFPRDDDGNGLPDNWENLYGLEYLAVSLRGPGGDPDQDGLTNLEELRYRTDPTKADTDGDGYGDGTEIGAGSNPLDPDSIPADDDKNGLPDIWENRYGLKDLPDDLGGPTGDPDGDGLTNLHELEYRTDPMNPDTDGDGLSDGDEVHTYHTDPLRPDTDGDGVNDGDEVAAGTDPLTAAEKTEIRAVNLNGYIIPPAIGVSPRKTSFSAPDQHFSGGTVSWTEDNVSVTGYFMAGKIYQAEVTLSAGAGYTFDAAVAALITYDYAVTGGVSHRPTVGLSDTLTVKLSFPALTLGTDIPVSDFDLAPYFAAPAAGGTPAAVISGAAPQYSGTVSWTPPPPAGEFVLDTVYTAAVHLNAKGGYTFEGVEADAFKHGGSSGINEAGSGDIMIVFPPTGKAGFLTLKGTMAGKTYTAEVFNTTGEVADYPAFRNATLASNRNAIGAGLGSVAVAGDLVVPLMSNSAPYTVSGEYLLTVQVTDTVTEAMEDIYYQARTPFVSGSAEFDLAAAKRRNRDLLDGAVTFKVALQRIRAGESGLFNLTPEGETIDSSFASNLQTINTDGDGDRIINGNGKTVTLAKTGALLTLHGEGMVTLGNITLKDNPSNTGLFIDLSAGLTLDEGAALTGTIGVQSNGKLVMKTGSLLSMGTTGVDVTGGSFEMSGGEISGNTVKGVSLSSGKFTMTGGAIKDNTTPTSGGGASMSATNGGGVSMSGGTFEMSGGEISGNIAATNGGGVYVSGGTFTMAVGINGGGEISDNKAGDGGGVYVSGGTFTMGMGKVNGNEAIANGGGVFVTRSGAFTMNGGEISGNKADSNGGGVGGKLTMNGGRISDNTATDGGGVYASMASYITGEISQNTANNNGGGIYALAGVTFHLGLTSIVNNTSKGSNSYGGVYFISTTVSQSPVDLEDIISGNSGFGSENKAEHNWTERGPMLGE
jgi:hypothetical protein